MSKLTDRQKQAITTKLKITKVATNLFKEKGFDCVKIQDICDCAEISVGAFYHHFKSKIDIINIAYEQVDILVMDRFQSEKFNCNLDKLLFLLGEGADVMEELGCVFVGEVYKNLISIDGKYSTKSDRHIAVKVKSIIQDAMDEGELTNTVSAQELTKTLMRISRGAIFDWCLYNGDYNLRSRFNYDLSLILSNFKINSDN